MVRFIKDRRGRKRYVQVTYREYRNIQAELGDSRVAMLIMHDELKRLQSIGLPDRLHLLGSQAN